MRVLIVESVSGFRREIDPRLFPEGFAMLRTMVNEFGDAGFDVVTIINERLKEYAGWLDARVLLGNGSLSDVLKLKPDATLVIAPEKNGELQKISAWLRKKGITVLGAKEESIRVSGDKWLTYLRLKEVVPQPRTWKKKPNFKGRILVKPIDGVGCEGIEFSESGFCRGIVYQEFIEGEHASCCLLMKDGKGIVLSVNKQKIVIRDGELDYLGSEIPLEHESVDECFRIALKAAEILDLDGFCGVDLIVNETPQFIELNPRVTTSFVALAEILNANLGEILIDTLIHEASIPRPKLEGYSIIRIPKTRCEIEMNSEKSNELREIPGIVAPPLSLGERLERGSPIFVALRSGNDAEIAKRNLDRTLDEATALLGIDQNDIVRD